MKFTLKDKFTVPGTDFGDNWKESLVKCSGRDFSGVGNISPGALGSAVNGLGSASGAQNAISSAKGIANNLNGNVTSTINDTASKVKAGVDGLASNIKGGLASIDGKLANGINNFKFPTSGSLGGLLGKGEDCKKADPKGPKATDNIFICSASEQLATIDAYKEASSDPINSFSEKAKGLNDSIKDGLRSVKSGLDTVRGAVTQARGVYDKVKSYKNAVNSITKGNGSLIDRVVAGNKLLKSGLADVGLTNLANSAIFSKVDSVAPTLIQYKNTFKEVSNTNLGDTKAIVGLLNTFTKDNDLYKIKDLGANVSFCADLVNKCTSFGVPNSLSEVVKILDNPTAKQELATKVMDTAVEKSNTSVIGEISEIFGDKALGGVFPHFERQFAKYYNRPFDSPASNDSKNYQEIKKVYDKVNPNWGTATRVTTDGDVDVIDLSAFVNASIPFVDVVTTAAMMANDADKEKYLAFISQTTSSTVTDEIAEQFPMVLVTPSCATTRNNVDPFVIAYR